MGLFLELKRRNVLRAAGAYIAVSWLVLQVTETLLPAFGLADAVLRTVLVVLAIGFVPAIAAAWAFELTPQGLVRDADVDRSSAQNRRMEKRLDRMLLVLLALAVAYFAADKFILDPARDRAREEAVAAAAADAARRDATTARGAGARTLAVLPFSAIGDGDESELFALGVHDDLLTRLARLGSLRVLSRTSVMKYRDSTMNLRDIGAALGADAILEGGVQSAGGRIRINAQLIEAATDEHLWAETYDRELSTASIFEVQADIATAIAEALQATMEPATAVALIPTQNMAAYRAFHEAMALRGARGGAITSDEYRDHLRRAVALDPGFLRPIAELVGSLCFGFFGGEAEANTIPEAEALLANLQELAPGSAEHLIAQSYYTYYVLKDYDLAHEVISAAYQQAPGDLQLLSLKSWIQRRQGDFEGMLATRREQQALDPENPAWVMSIVANLAALHRYAEAQALAERHVEAQPMLQQVLVRLRVRQHGDLSRLARELADLKRAMPGRWLSDEELAMAFVDARDYARAEEILTGIENSALTAEASHFGIAAKTMNLLELYWLTGQTDAVAALLPEGRAQYASHARPRTDGSQRLGRAFLEVMAGDADAARDEVATWMRESAADPAARAGAFYFACQVLGMAGHADDTVDCLRAGLREPSYITPFITPRLPHFDTVRDTPPFEALLRDLDDAAT